MIQDRKGRFVAGANKGSENPNWKGAEVKYSGLHEWVRRRLGKPNMCTACGTDDSARMYHWANISGEYRRDLKDWKRLCVSCHKKNDITPQAIRNMSLSHTKVDGEKVRVLYKTGLYSQRKLAKMLNTSQGNVSNIVNYKTQKYA